jgi:hypothetical protein
MEQLAKDCIKSQSLNKQLQGAEELKVNAEIQTENQA